MYSHIVQSLRINEVLAGIKIKYRSRWYCYVIACRVEPWYYINVDSGALDAFSLELHSSLELE